MGGPYADHICTDEPSGSLSSTAARELMHLVCCIFYGRGHSYNKWGLFLCGSPLFMPALVDDDGHDCNRKGGVPRGTKR